MEIIQIPVLNDNYVHLLYDAVQSQAIAIDPAVAQPIQAHLAKLGADLVAIWNTHHHSDHVGGNRELLQCFPQAQVVAGTYDQSRGRIPGQTKAVAEGDRLEFAGLTAQVLDCPGHTLGHIAYYFPPQPGLSVPQLFCGDTLFVNGCGRLFEGTPQQMMLSLATFRDLPAATQVWCAHEYTLNNLKFALSLEPNHVGLRRQYQEAQNQRRAGQSTVPTTIALEQAHNPFLRWDDPALQQVLNCDRPLDVFTKTRRRKDKF